MVLKTERNVADVMDTEGDENRCCLCMDLIECWAIGKCKHPGQGSKSRIISGFYKVGCIFLMIAIGAA